MDQYKEGKESKYVNLYTGIKARLTSILGVLFTLVGIAVIFIISSLEGTKEIKASSGDNTKIISLWREENDDLLFPEERGELIEYKDKEYYFIIDEKNEEGVITKWHFAYDGGIDYIFKDYKFYVLTSLTIIIAIYVSDINYMSTVRQITGSEQFILTLQHYQEKKQKVSNFSQYIPLYCNYKNKQMYDDKVRDIVEDAGLSYKDYISEEFDVKKLEKWKVKKLKKIRRVSVKKLRTSDLMQEHGNLNFNKIALLPVGQSEHRRDFLVRGGVQKVISSALSGVTMAFGIVFGNWVLGITYGMIVLTSFISSILIATDFATSTLRQRFIAKADLLVEFDNIKDKFIEKVVYNEKEELPKPVEIVEQVTEPERKEVIKDELQPE